MNIFILFYFAMATPTPTYTRIGQTDDNGIIISISPSYLSAWNQFVSIYPTVHPELEEQRQKSEISPI